MARVAPMWLGISFVAICFAPGATIAQSRPVAATAPVISSPNSIWNVPISSNAPMQPNSSALVAAIAASAGTEGGYPNTTQWSVPIYVVPKSQPLVKVFADPRNGGTPALQAALNQGVPIPPNAQPSLPYPGDNMLTISQPSKNSLWDFWETATPAQNAPGVGLYPAGYNEWSLGWGGVMTNASLSPGYFDQSSFPGDSTTSWGNSASSIVLAGGVPLISEMEAGQINHAIGFSLPWAVNCESENVWPAQRNDGANTAANCVPEGTKIWLDPSVNLVSLHLSHVAYMIAAAAQKYGMVLDNSGGSLPVVQLEDPTQYGTNPYTAKGGLFGGLQSSQIFANFPWADMHVLASSVRIDGKTPRLTTTATAQPQTSSVVVGQSVSVNVKVTRSDSSPALGAVYLLDGGAAESMELLSGGSADEAAVSSTSAKFVVNVTAPAAGGTTAPASNSVANSTSTSSTTPAANAVNAGGPPSSTSPSSSQGGATSTAPSQPSIASPSPIDLPGDVSHDVVGGVLGLFNSHNDWTLIPKSFGQVPRTLLLYICLGVFALVVLPRTRRFIFSLPKRLHLQANRR
jgi:hypothetical protein